MNITSITREELEKKYKIERSAKKKNLLKILVIIISIAISFFLVYHFSFPRFVSFPEKLTDETILLKRIEGEECSIFITGPSKEIVFYADYDCREYILTRTEITEYFGNVGGEYKITVTSNSGKNFVKSYLVKR